MQPQRRDVYGTLIADTALVGLTAAYAHWLDEHKGLEPDHTWAEVVFGVGLCLAHAALRMRITGGEWAAYEATIWRSFCLGGAPVIAGELNQALRRYRKRVGWTPPLPREKRTPYVKLTQ